MAASSWLGLRRLHSDKIRINISSKFPLIYDEAGPPLLVICCHGRILIFIRPGALHLTALSISISLWSVKSRSEMSSSSTS